MQKFYKGGANKERGAAVCSVRRSTGRQYLIILLVILMGGEIDTRGGTRTLETHIHTSTDLVTIL